MGAVILFIIGAIYTIWCGFDAYKKENKK